MIDINVKRLLDVSDKKIEDIEARVARIELQLNNLAKEIMVIKQSLEALTRARQQPPA